MKWRLALKIATSPSERWLMKAAEWNPELSSKYRTEDDINEFLKLEENETENSTESDNRYSKTWINKAQRPRKMDSIRRQIHNGCRRTT